MTLHIETSPIIATRLLSLAKDFESHSMSETLESLIDAVYFSKNRKKASRLIREAKKVKELAK